MKKLKVLHYIPGFSTGGIESVFLNWYRNSDQNRVDFELLVRSYDPESPMLQEYLALGGKLYTLDTPSLNIKTMFAFYQKVRGFFNAHRDYDFLHVHVADDPFVISVAKRKGIKQIGVHAHTTGYNETYKSQGTKGKIRNRNVKLAQHHIAITQAAKKWMFPVEKNVQIIHNGINTKAYSFDQEVRDTYRKQLQVKDQYVIMHVGRFSEVKNHTFMLDLYEKVKRKLPNSRLIFVGDGPLYEEFQDEVKQRSLQNEVIFLGARIDVPELLQAADVFILPSKFEGLGLSAVEAQAAGLPTLVSDRVPTEVAITDLVTFIPLENFYQWELELEKAVAIDRRNTYQEIVDAHYDIKQTVQDLTDFYFSTYKE